MGCKVLIVETNEEFRDHLQQRLTRNGFTVFGVATLKEGELVAREERVQAILLGVAEHQRARLSFVREVSDSCPEASVVIINHSDDMALSMAGMEYGALDEITAPVDMTVLEKRLNAICQGRIKR